MTAPLCPVHKRPGRYVFGSMVTCELEDAELKAAKTPPAKASYSVTFNSKPLEGAVYAPVYVTVAPPRAPQPGDRALASGCYVGTLVQFGGIDSEYAYVRNDQGGFGYTVTIYDACDLTFEPPVTP